MTVLIRSRLRRVRVDESAVGTLGRRVLLAAGERDAELSVLFVGDRKMRVLNRCYRGKDRPTDVLAFPLREAAGPRTPLLGDVVISLDTAARQAAAAGAPLDREIAKLLIHGVLHLIGYDHERSESEARRMARRERAVSLAVGRIPKLTDGSPAAGPKPHSNQR